MLRIVVLLIAVFTLFSQMDVNAQQYHIDVQRYNNPYLNSSTYDINVRRQPQIGANILDIRRMFLFSQPTQTRSLLEAEREASASRRADAEPNCYEHRLNCYAINYRWRNKGNASRIKMSNAQRQNQCQRSASNLGNANMSPLMPCGGTNLGNTNLGNTDPAPARNK